MLDFLLDALPWMALAATLGYLVGHLLFSRHCDELHDELARCEGDLAQREAELDRVTQRLVDEQQRGSELTRQADRLGADYLALQADRGAFAPAR
jgi:chromosome segregation ATPase